MNYHRWSALLRGYDITLRYNQWILVLSVAGVVWGMVQSNGGLGPRVIAAVVAGSTVFGAAALAKELDPDRPRAAWIAAALVLPSAGILHTISPVVLFWLLGCIRFVNRTPGLRAKGSDILVLLAVSVWLSAVVTPLFGLLLGTLLILDAILADGQKVNSAIGVAALITFGVWLFQEGWSILSPPFWLVIVLLAIAVATILVIINSYDVVSVGDATGERLNSMRVQVGQAFALSAGLFLASWLGESGILLLVGLWAALITVLINHVVLMRYRHSITFPE